MRTTVLVLFWVLLFNAFMDIGYIARDTYPRKRDPRGMGLDLVSFIINIVFALLVAWVLWS